MTDATDWPVAATALWGRLTAYPFEHREDGLDLTHRLARAQGWTLDQARAAIAEYRRFCFLCCVAGEFMTPSREVDAVWHLHLSDTRDYWDVFCPQVLGTPLHHEPTRDGSAAGRHDHEQYARTLAAYERWFGPPPLACWPGTRERFADPAHGRMVDRHRFPIPPRLRRPGQRGWLSRSGPVLGVLILAMAFPLSPNPLNWIGDPFVLPMVLLGGAPWVVALVLSQRRSQRKRESGAGRAEGLEFYQWAYLAGGPARAIDAAVAHLLTQGAAQFDRNSGRLSLTGPVSELPIALQELGTAIAQDGRPAALRRNATRWLEPLRIGLVWRGLVLSEEVFQQVRQLAILPFVALASFEVGKITIALSHGWLLGFLVAIAVTLAAGGVGLWRFLTAPTRTRAGDRALDDAHDRFARAARAPTKDETGLAVALGGIDALSDAMLAGYQGVAPSLTARA